MAVHWAGLANRPMRAIYHRVESKEALLFQRLMERYQALLSHVELHSCRP